MKTISLLIALSAPVALAQTAGSERQACTFSYGLQNAQATRAFNNQRTGCSYWVLTYSQVGASAVTRVETSQDNSSWTEALTVVSGTHPTTGGAGFGRVLLSGYAPYIRVRCSGTGTTSGLLYGSIATINGATIPKSYTGINPAEWSYLDTANFDPATKTSGGDFIFSDLAPGNAGGPQASMLCKTVDGANGHYRLTQRWPGHTNGNAQFGMALRNDSTGAMMLIISQYSGTILQDGIFYCSDESNCSDRYFGFNMRWGQEPSNWSIKVESGGYTLETFDGYRYVPLLNNTVFARASNLNTFNKVCYYQRQTGGDFWYYGQLLGYDYLGL